MNKIFPKVATREALLDSLPDTDVTSTESSRKPQFTYVPTSHARALSPENIIVEGIRGAGKSHWWSVLASSDHKHYLASAFPETKIADNVDISQGFGIGLSPDAWPSKDVLDGLSKKYNPKHIWKALIAIHLKFPSPFPITKKWDDRVSWVQDHSEDYERLLYQADNELTTKNTTKLIIFDALDRLADDWPKIRPLAKALFQLALDLRSTRSIRMKLFVRPDMLQDKSILAFPDSSKLLSKKVDLRWSRSDLYALLFQCLGNSDKQGNIFREYCKSAFNVAWRQHENSDAWVVPNELRHDELLQRNVFHAIAGEAMGNSPKRGYPYTWLPNHLLDGLDQVSPRSFIAAIKRAASEFQPEDWPYALHYKAIQKGVQEASQIRVNEITSEDYPWVRSLMTPLGGAGAISVPCQVDDILHRWEERNLIGHLQAEILKQDSDVKLPPARIEEGAKGVLQDLIDLGIVQKLWDGRIQMPDVYRIAFGLGRKGGVKPLK
jgi:hypothetical protein